MVYLEDHPPKVRQCRSPRRALPSGVIVVHTAESYPDEVGPDTGAENVAHFIATRTTFGSYHDLCDSDSIVHVVPYDAEAYGDGTGSNPHAYHVSAATQAARWPTLGDEWVDGTVRNMARASARYARWLKAERGITIPAKRITRAESDRLVPGFISHGERDPGRRTDPGNAFPWDAFLDHYAAEMGGTTTPLEDDDMPYGDWPKADREKLVKDVVAGILGYRNPKDGADLWARLKAIQSQVQTSNLRATVWGHRGKNAISGGSATMDQFIRSGYANQWRAASEQSGQVAGLTEAVAQLAAGQSIDVDAIMEAAREGARQGVGELLSADVDVSIELGETDDEHPVTPGIDR